jgi:thiol-disulfide isomerase/thioredoxin
MIKKLFCFLGILCITQHVLAQVNYEILKDPKNGEPVYKGLVTFFDLHADADLSWLKRGMDKYKPNVNAMNYLKKNLGNYTLVVFMGTWCDDTKELLPKFEKVLNASAYPLTKLTLFGVDRDKKAKNIENKLYKVEYVPTIIVFKGHYEIGRITETVKESVEKDLMEIIKKDAEPGNEGAH